MTYSDMFKKTFKGLIIVGIVALVGTNIYLAQDGKVSIWFFSVVITFFFLITEGILKIAACSRRTKIHTRLFLSSVFLAILLGELVLRSLGMVASFNEKKGNYYYLSPYHVTWDKSKSWLHIREDRNEKSVEIYPEFTYVVEVNSEALRDVNHTEIKATDEYRIVGLGDSFTEGVGATLNEHSWAKMLEKTFRINDTSTTIVFNGGVSGSDPFFEYMLLKEKLLKYDPDLVIVAINTSDINDVIVRGGMERFQPDTTVNFRSGPWIEPIFGMSRVCRLLMLKVFGYDWYLLRPGERKEETQKALDLIYSCILKFEEMSQEEAFDLLILFHPLQYEVVAAEFELDELIVKLEKETTIDVLNLLEYYINDEKVNADNVEIYYWPVDQHHNEAGYALFARGVKQKIERLNQEDQLSTDN